MLLVHGSMVRPVVEIFYNILFFIIDILNDKDKHNLNLIK